MVQLSDKVILGSAALALLAYIYSVRQTTSLATSVGGSFKGGATRLYEDAGSVAQIGYQDAKDIGGDVKSAGKRAVGWLKRRF